MTHSFHTSTNFEEIMFISKDDIVIKLYNNGSILCTIIEACNFLWLVHSEPCIPVEIISLSFCICSQYK